MTHNDQPISLPQPLPLSFNRGDNTIVLEPPGIPTTRPTEDLTYTVTIGNVDIGGTPTQFTYDVIIIDPDVDIVDPTGEDGGRWTLYN